MVAAAVCIGIWELRRAMATRGIQLPFEPLVAGSLAMVFGAWFGGAPPVGAALAVTALAVMLWRLRAGVDGFVRDATAGVFTAVYLPFLAAFVILLLRDDDGIWRVVTFILVTIASDIGGYAVGVLFGKHPMAPVVSPKKSWEGFAGSAVSCMVVGWLTVDYLLDGRWWVGVLLGMVAVVTATLGDLCESVIKRDLGIKDMSQIIPGHGGLMDRLDSLLATVAPTWLLLYYLVEVSPAAGL
jgi:phosphatidate cytidylyltransferase